MVVNNNVLESEGLRGLFKNLGKKESNVSKKIAKNVLTTSGRALDVTATNATAAASGNPTKCNVNTT